MTVHGGDDGDGGAAMGAGSDPGPDANLDRDLRDSFAALRRQEEAAAPGFGTLSELAARRRRRARGRKRRLQPLAAAAATAAVACAALVLATSPWLRPHARPAGTYAPAPSISAWRPATDFLLRTPGHEVLVRLPAFGSSSAMGGVDPYFRDLYDFHDVHDFHRQGGTAAGHGNVTRRPRA
jgi:hypothetical protein